MPRSAQKPSFAFLSTPSHFARPTSYIRIPSLSTLTTCTRAILEWTVAPLSGQSGGSLPATPQTETFTFQVSARVSRLGFSARSRAVVGDEHLHSHVLVGNASSPPYRISTISTAMWYYPGRPGRVGGGGGLRHGWRAYPITHGRREQGQAFLSLPGPEEHRIGVGRKKGSKPR